jgi:hypothetical protein
MEEADHFINTMALRELIEAMDPPPHQRCRRRRAS